MTERERTPIEAASSARLDCAIIAHILLVVSEADSVEPDDIAWLAQRLDEDLDKIEVVLEGMRRVEWGMPPRPVACDQGDAT